MMRISCKSFVHFLQLSGAGLASLSSAHAQQSTNLQDIRCSDDTDVVTYLTPSVGHAEISGTNQTIYDIGYLRADCVSEKSLTRWNLEVNAGHVEEKSFQSDSATVGLGFSLHPIKGHDSLSLIPMVRLGYERLRGIPDNFVYGADLTLYDSIPLYTSGGVQGRLAVTSRVAYIERHTLQTSLSLIGKDGQLTWFSAGSLELPVSKKFQFNLLGGYQTLRQSVIKGYSTFQLELLPTTSPGNYKFGLQVTGNVGAKHYRSILVGLVVRFVDSRKKR